MYLKIKQFFDENIIKKDKVLLQNDYKKNLLFILLLFQYYYFLRSTSKNIVSNLKKRVFLYNLLLKLSSITK